MISCDGRLRRGECERKEDPVMFDDGRWCVRCRKRAEEIEAT